MELGLIMSKKRYCETKKCAKIVDSEIIVGNVKHYLCFACMIRLHGDLELMLFPEEETELIEAPDAPLEIYELIDPDDTQVEIEEPKERRTESGIILA